MGPAGTKTPQGRKILGILICLWFPFTHWQFISKEAGIQTYLCNVCIVKCQLLTHHHHNYLLVAWYYYSNHKAALFPSSQVKILEGLANIQIKQAGISYLPKASVALLHHSTVASVMIRGSNKSFKNPRYLPIYPMTCFIQSATQIAGFPNTPSSIIWDQSLILHF